jgi:hypothetical protein
VRDTKAHRPIPEGSRPKYIQEFGPEELKILNCLEMAKLIHDEYERSTHQKFAGIHDKRVTNLNMSLGYHIL